MLCPDFGRKGLSLRLLALWPFFEPPRDSFAALLLVTRRVAFKIFLDCIDYFFLVEPQKLIKLVSQSCQRVLTLVLAFFTIN